MPNKNIRGYTIMVAGCLDIDGFITSQLIRWSKARSVPTARKIQLSVEI
jgi:hypothetical protein